MRFKPGHKDQTRARLLEAAGRQIRKRGLYLPAVSDVMAEAGLTVGAFYGHFDSRDALMHEAVRQMCRTSPLAHLAENSEQTSPADTLREFLDNYLSPEHRDMLNGGCPLPFLMADSPRLAPELRERLSDIQKATITFIAKQIGGLGTFRDPPEQMAMAIVAEIVGALILARAEPDPDRSQTILYTIKSSILSRLGLRLQS